MPIYEYVCNCCGEKFELLRRFSDSDHEIKCTRCGKPDTQRILSSFSTSSSTADCTPSSSGGST